MAGIHLPITQSQQRAIESGVFLGQVHVIPSHQCVSLWGSESSAAPLPEVSQVAQPMTYGSNVTLFGAITSWESTVTEVVFRIECSPNAVTWFPSGYGDVRVQKAVSEHGFSIFLQCTAPFIRVRCISGGAYAACTGQLFCALRA
jgi:hypothetical protein